MRLVLDIIIRGTLAGMAVQGFFFSKKLGNRFLTGD